MTSTLPARLPALKSAVRVGRQIGQVHFGEAEAGEEGVAERLVAVERIGLGADPDRQVAVARPRSPGRPSRRPPSRRTRTARSCRGRRCRRCGCCSRRCLRCCRSRPARRRSCPGKPWTRRRVDLSRLKALALTDTPPDVNVRMLPSVPSMALLPEKSNVLAAPAVPSRFWTVPLALYSQTSPGSRMLSASPRLNAEEGDLAVGGAEVVGSVARRAVVVGDHDLAGVNGDVAGVGDLVGPGDGGAGVRIGTPGPLAASSLS